MSLSPEEQQILEYAKNNGKSPVEAKLAIAKYRQQNQVHQPAPQDNRSTMDRITGGAQKVTNFLGMGAATDVLGRAIARTGVGARLTGSDVETNRQFVEAPTRSQVGGALLQTGVTAASLAIPAALPLKAAIGAGAVAGYAYDIGQDLAAGKSTQEVLTPGMGAVAGSLGPVAGPAAVGAGKAIKAGAEAATTAVTNSPVVKGALQTGIEFAERVPRFVSKKQVELRDQATKAQRMATAPEPVRNALKADVPEPIINTIEQADDATREGYRQIVQLAEESVSTTGTLKTSARPEIVAGEAVAEQYKLVDAKQKEIGAAIGEAVKSLSKDTDIYSMRPAYNELNDALADARIGITMAPDKSVGTLNFGKSGFTRAQRAKIQELYELATEGGDALTAAEIHAKDRLFSQLQREARMEGIGDIMVDTPEGKMSLFRIFRDVYSDNLERLSPELKTLNRQYRNLSTFTEEIENTLIKTGKFETNSKIDPSEYAQTNLRRLFSEAQSATDYRAIAEELDNASRALGYSGAKPEDLARFALEMRKIYPDTTPRTGIEGVMRTSFGGMVDTIMNAGKADLTDQQKAIRALLESSDALQQ